MNIPILKSSQRESSHALVKKQLCARWIREREGKNSERPAMNQQTRKSLEIILTPRFSAKRRMIRDTFPKQRFLRCRASAAEIVTEAAKEREKESESIQKIARYNKWVEESGGIGTRVGVKNISKNLWKIDSFAIFGKCCLMGRAVTGDDCRGVESRWSRCWFMRRSGFCARVFLECEDYVINWKISWLFLNAAAANRVYNMPFFIL